MLKNFKILKKSLNLKFRPNKRKSGKTAKCLDDKLKWTQDSESRSQN